jgi:pimeloyl-ACP methyl ester carboxylesterase
MDNLNQRPALKHETGAFNFSFLTVKLREYCEKRSYTPKNNKKTAKKSSFCPWKLIDALDYQKVNLVGHDWGAAVAWMLAIWNPERLHRLGIINVPHPAVMKRFLLRDLEQIRRSWYIFFFQLPWLPEAGLRAGDWRGASHAMRSSGKIDTFTDEDIEKHKEAWSQPGAITAMLNWYRAAVRYQARITNDMRVKVPALMMWGMKDVALSHRMARPSMDYCDDGKLLFFTEATHWIQHEEANEVNQHLLEFIFT